MLNNYTALLEFFNETQAFVDAVEYTSGQAGFLNKLIEKDYICSMVLMYLYANNDGLLIFKGGTLLAKVHANFYRLSEDLDFTVSIPTTATRKKEVI